MNFSFINDIFKVKIFLETCFYDAFLYFNRSSEQSENKIKEHMNDYYIPWLYNGIKSFKKTFNSKQNKTKNWKPKVQIQKELEDLYKAVPNKLMTIR